jgi:hypothetical protein
MTTRLLLIAAVLALCSLPTIQADEATWMPEAFETKGIFEKEVEPENSVDPARDETATPVYENKETKDELKRNKDADPARKETSIPFYENEETKDKLKRYKDTDPARDEETEIPVDENEETKDELKRNKVTNGIDPCALPPRLHGNLRKVNCLKRINPRRSK